MITILKGRKIRVEWCILKGTSPVREDFSRSSVKVFLVGPFDRYLLSADPSSGILVASIPEGLPEGAYSIEAVWVKNWGNLHDSRYNDRCVCRSRKDFVFAITEYESEATNIGQGSVVVRIKSSVATYGYDGLSAYEISVLRGDFAGNESDWLEWVHNQLLDNMGRFLNDIYLEYKGSASATRNSLPACMRRKGVVITYMDGMRNVVTEYCCDDSATDDANWGLSDNWKPMSFETGLIDSYESDDVNRAPTAAALHRLYEYHRKSEISASAALSAIQDIFRLSSEIGVSHPSMVLSGSAQAVPVCIVCNGAWNISPSSGQVTAYPASGTGTTEVELRFNANAGGSDISGILTVSNTSGKSRTISFTQHSV